MIRRREFITGIGSAAAWPVVARAQQQALPVIGFLSSGNPGSLVFGQILAAFGHTAVRLTERTISA
jgi:hypothetical protein